MKTSMKITVTEEDIKRGKIDSCLCPIALATLRLGYTNVNVWTDRLYCKDKQGNISEYTLSRRAIKFIERFDNGLSVKSSNFKLSLIKKDLYDSLPFI